MNNEGIVNEGLINFHADGGNRDIVLAEMSRALKEQNRITDIDAFLQDVWERENISSTDTGIGIAIPHGKGSSVLETSVAIYRFNNGLIWDRDPVKAVFLLAVDDNEAGLVHLEIISKISALLMDDGFLNKLYMTDSESAFYKYLLKRLKEIK